MKYNQLLGSTMTIVQNDPRYLTGIQGEDTRKHCHESAFMTAIHILICLTKEGKSHEEIAAMDFDHNLELVSVWIDYMIGIDWVYKNKDDDVTNGKWVVTEKGKRWIQKYYYHITRKG